MTNKAKGNNEIKYLVYYALPNDPQERSHTLAADNFIDYVSDAIIETGHPLYLISASPTKSKTKGHKGYVKELSANKKIKFFRTFPWNNAFNKLLNVICINSSILLELLKVPRGQVVLVYHSTAYMSTVRIARWFKRFSLLLYIGEVYADVYCDENKRKKELSYFQCADRYMFATEFLDKLINVKGKPSIVLYGAYKNEKAIEGLMKDSNKVHCVYAGTFDSRKGEAQQTVAACRYLPDNYCVHICGFGNDKDTYALLHEIENINTEHPGRICYEGSLRGEPFITLLQKCDIGLFTPISKAEFNETDFPSKILSYMTNGLHVVSARVGPVEHSPIGQYMTFYDGDEPTAIAKAIQEVDVTKAYDSRAIVEKLEKDFIKEFKSILN